MNKDKKRNLLRIIIALGVIAVIVSSPFVYMEYKRYTIKKQWKEDVALFARGIKQGIPLAIYGLGFAYHTGHGVPKDHRKARELYKQAAEKGEMLAQYNLGFMYQNGEGGSEDIEKAIYYYKQAADQNLSFALSGLSEIYSQGLGVKKDPEKVQEFEQRSVGNLGKSLSYRTQYKQIIKYQLGEF